MFSQLGYVQGICPKCGRTLQRRRPADYAVCDCHRCCPLCGNEMEPYTPDLTPSTYGPIDSETATGDIEKPIDVLYYCPYCNYYSAQKPVEVHLS